MTGVKQYNKTKYRRLIAFLPVLCIMILIFVFSSKDGTESAGTSFPITTVILQLTEKIIGSNMSNKAEYVDLIHTLIRKVAHITEYAILGFSICFFLNTFPLKRNYFFVIAMSSGISYAITDEIHQIFVPGRSGSFVDVMIDSLGCLIGTLFFLLIRKQMRRKRSKEKQISQIN